MKIRPLISDNDIEAFLSGTLSRTRRLVIEEALVADPNLRTRMDALKADQKALQTLGAELLVEPVPDRFLRLLTSTDDDSDKKCSSAKELIIDSEVPQDHGRRDA